MGRGKGETQPQTGILYQTVSRLLVANRVFLGSWVVDICQEGHKPEISSPEEMHGTPETALLLCT